MQQIKICGVPEHFNLPWELCIENQEFTKENIDLQWTNIPEGTGKMCQMLRNNETDIAVILTEGIVKDIGAGNNSKIVQIFVESPLIWGIHVAANSNYHSISDLKNKKAAISRLGSGSQLMAFVNAKNQNWNTENIDFEIVNTIDGAVESLTNGLADYFMWEKFMTQPLVDAGIFRRVGTCPTPWPCFVIAVRNEILEKQPEIISKILKIINKKTNIFKTIPAIDAVLASKFNQKITDIQQWLSITDWSDNNLSVKSFNSIQNQLFDLKIIDKKTTFANAVQKV
jgi:ABC-type nitrate/sulfonate/bicarbonate transport system substrate-binding protein